MCTKLFFKRYFKTTIWRSVQITGNIAIYTAEIVLLSISADFFFHSEKNKTILFGNKLQLDYMYRNENVWKSAVQTAVMTSFSATASMKAGKAQIVSSHQERFMWAM